ncbi:MAG: hypothetical protein MI757_19430 [Pirellulales bacterium]|nr:hypothetical protein [Pirellulales bacterium]
MDILRDIVRMPLIVAGAVLLFSMRALGVIVLTASLVTSIFWFTGELTGVGWPIFGGVVGGSLVLVGAGLVSRLYGPR